MFVVDDPLMALILRFVVDTEASDSSNEEFLRRQLKHLSRYLTRFPEAEHRNRALDWVAEHAARYRRDWERNTVAARTVYLRCADCPLAGVGATEHCEIHEQWLYLLHRYLADETTSREYIEHALALLAEYKIQHRHRLQSAAIDTSVSPDKKKGGRKDKNKNKGKKRKKKKDRKPD